SGNAGTDLRTVGVSSAFNGTSLVIQNSDGQDIAIELNPSAAITSTIGVTGLNGASVNIDASGAGTDTVQVGGKVNIFLASGYTIESSVNNAGGSLFNKAAAATAATTATNVGIDDVSPATGDTTNQGNGTAAQTLTVVGAASSTVSVAANATAAAVANGVNAVSSSTGVTAEAITKAKLSALSANGTVSFDLYGTNTTAAAISATVTTTDLSSLATAINLKTGLTGITAALTDSNTSLTLTLATGEDIRIANFGHSAAAGLSSASITGTEQSMTVNGLSDQINSSTGLISTTTTTSAILYDGGVARGVADSTEVGGTVSFKSDTSFNVTSSVTGASTALASSSIFSGIASSSNTSTLSSLDLVDISSVTGANAAISVLDGALTQINTLRSAMGAMQNRFQSTISNLQATGENVSAARSRIQDTDFAAETGNLTRNQILQQAGTAMLAQANQLPQLVLSLLK
ncbi:MAG: flagellin, partial [Proteobacteria bacterium]|nr:flagellin [Pseudomonadota bacterium]